MDRNKDQYLSEVRQQIRDGIERVRQKIEHAEAAFLTRRLMISEQNESKGNQPQGEEGS